jgi:hypothetical protein
LFVVFLRCGCFSAEKSNRKVEKWDGPALVNDTASLYDEKYVLILKRSSAFAAESGQTRNAIYDGRLEQKETEKFFFSF